MKRKVSRAALGRVSLYINFLQKNSDNKYISATQISKQLNLGEVMVRKDLASLAGSGKPKIGYDRLKLIEQLNVYLLNDNGGAIIVGAGKLGNALLNFPGFDEYGIEILAAFDHHPKISLSSNKKIYLLDEMEQFIKDNDVKIAILTVPDKAAQEIFDRLYKCGIRLFSCFCTQKINAPEDAIIQYENLALSLAHLKTLNKNGF